MAGPVPAFARERPRAPSQGVHVLQEAFPHKRVSWPEMWAESEGQRVQVRFIMFSQPCL